MKDISSERTQYLSLWNKLINNIVENPRDFKTHPINKNKNGHWFNAISDGKSIYISNAKENEPSCKISTTRKLTYDIFKKIYPIHMRRENKEMVSQEAQEVTFNQVYWFSLIYNCLDTEGGN